MGIMLTTGDGPIDLVDHSCLSTIFSRVRFTNQTRPRPPYPDRARVGTDFSTPIHPQKPCTCAKGKCAHMRKDAQTAHILSGRYAQNGSSDILRKPSKRGESWKMPKCKRVVFKNTLKYENRSQANQSTSGLMWDLTFAC